MSSTTVRISWSNVLYGLLTRVILRLPSVVYGFARTIRIDRDKTTWGTLLESAAHRYPNNLAVKSHEGQMTYRELDARANQVAHWLASHGVGRGDVVNVMLEARPELIALYCGIAKLGAINAMINTRLRGDALCHQLDMHPGKLHIIGAECWEAYHEATCRPPECDVAWIREALDGEAMCPDGVEDGLDAMDRQSTARVAALDEVIPADTIAYVFTSGTTGGQPKAARVTHKRVTSSCFFNGFIVLGMTGSDTLYLPLPFFHTNALALAWPACFARGSAVAIRRRFSVSAFLDDVRTFQATTFCYIGEICRYLLSTPARSDDADTPLVKMIGNGLRSDVWQAFQARFGIEQVFEIYGAADGNLYFVNLLNLRYTIGMSVTPYALVAPDLAEGVPLRDEQGRVRRVEPGSPGLLLGKVTRLSPFTGYSNQAESEKKLVRDAFESGDAWFNTGDLVQDLGYRHLQFVDRLGDTFRWKGENVATADLETVANRVEPIEVSAAYGVAMPGGDGRAGMVAVVVRDDVFPAEALARAFEAELPSFARPIFARVVGSMDTTATHKLKKFTLRDEGFDLGRVKDPIYVWLPKADRYEPLTPAIHRDLVAGVYRF